MEEKKVGLYGGTFSPPHQGHVNAAANFVRAMDLDRLIVMPAGIPPHKVVEDPVPNEARLEMCRLAFGEIDAAEVSDFEISKDGLSYTVDTLRYLYPAYGKIYLLCGDDMLLTLDRWRESSEIFRMAHIVCMRRYDTDASKLYEKAAEYGERFSASVTFIDADPLPVSSTDVREMLKRGDGAVAGFLSDAVLRYIKEKGLYESTLEG
ncbi:MAG: nicotinate (nicotinamide) nucleotide adenylyltransferase [Clostridia bacterium]|nr:nicotinate (nicotinamide) nucleotide adenylyltransferase [Clostridia bacterium]